MRSGIVLGLKNVTMRNHNASTSAGDQRFTTGIASQRFRKPYDIDILFRVITVRCSALTVTIRLRRPWTRAFFRPASRTVGFSLRFKNSGHVMMFLRRCGLQNTDHVMPFWLFPRPLKVDACVIFFPPFLKSRGRKDVLCTI